MILRVVLVLFIAASTAFSQNNLIIFSSNAGLFNVKAVGLTHEEGFKQEIKYELITNDTLNLNISTEKEDLKLSRKLFLLEKGKSVTNKEFVYSLELNSETKKLKLVFVTVHDIKPLPDPLLPNKPNADTSYKWRNNVFGTLFELKEGKAIFYFNLPKNGGCVEGMSQANLNYAITLLNRTTYDFEKYKYALEIVKSNCLSCKQLGAILKAVNFELDKLKLIKDSYSNLIDKKELPTLKECFRFESSKKEFNGMVANPESMLQAKNKVNCTQPEKDSVIIQLANNLKLFSTDYEKFQFMKEKAATYCFTTVQFKSVLTIFVHDREKLDLTKLFYNNITNKENLVILNDIFSYRESVIDLEDFLKQEN